MAELNEKEKAQLEKLEQRQAQLKAEYKAKVRAIKHQASRRERNERTKRLIEIGATVESVLGRPIPKEDLPKLLNFLKQQEERGGFFSKAMEKGNENESKVRIKVIE